MPHLRKKENIIIVELVFVGALLCHPELVSGSADRALRQAGGPELTPEG